MFSHTVRPSPFPLLFNACSHLGYLPPLLHSPLLPRNFLLSLSLFFFSSISNEYIFFEYIILLPLPATNLLPLSLRVYSSSSSASSSLPRVIYFSSLSAYFSSSFLACHDLILLFLSPRIPRAFFLFLPRVYSSSSSISSPSSLPSTTSTRMSHDFSQTLAPSSSLSLSLPGRITYNYPKTRLHGAWERLSTLVMPSQSPVHIGPLESGWLEERRLGRREEMLMRTNAGRGKRERRSGRRRRRGRRRKRRRRKSYRFLGSESVYTIPLYLCWYQNSTCSSSRSIFQVLPWEWFSCH